MAGISPDPAIPRYIGITTVDLQTRCLVQGSKSMPCESHPPLTDQELDTMECRARAYCNAWAGNPRPLAADVMLLLRERQRLIVALAMLREQYSIERYQQQRGRD